MKSNLDTLTHLLEQLYGPKSTLSFSNPGLKIGNPSYAQSLQCLLFTDLGHKLGYSGTPDISWVSVKKEKAHLLTNPGLIQ